MERGPSASWWALAPMSRTPTTRVFFVIRRAAARVSTSRFAQSPLHVDHVLARLGLVERTPRLRRSLQHRVRNLELHALELRAGESLPKWNEKRVEERQGKRRLPLESARADRKADMAGDC